MREKASFIHQLPPVLRWQIILLPLPGLARILPPFKGGG